MVFTDLPFLGRGHEMTRLQEKLNHAVNHRGSCVFINGNSGAGKSRFVSEFIGKKVDPDILVLKIEIGDLTTSDQQLLFSVVREYLKTVRTLKLIPKMIDDATYQFCSPHIPELAACFPYEPPAAPARLTVNEMLYRFFYNLTVFSPVVVLVEDIHAASPEMIKALEYIISKIKSLPMMFLLTARPSLSCGALLNRLRPAIDTELVELRALNINELMQLNAALFNDQLPPVFFTWLSGKTKGDPIFIKEVLRYLLEKGIVFLDSIRDSWTLIEPVKNIPLPGGLYEIIAAHVRLLKPPARDFVLYAALVDVPVPPSLIGIRLSVREKNAIQKTGIMMVQNGGFSFSHPLYREAICNMVPGPERLGMHEKLGDLLMAKKRRELALVQYLKAGRHDRAVIRGLIRLVKDYRMKEDYTRALNYGELIFNVFKNDPREAPGRYFEWAIAYIGDLINQGNSRLALEVCETFLDRIPKAPAVIARNELARLHAIHIKALYYAGRYQDAVDLSAGALDHVKLAPAGKRKALAFDIELHAAYALQDLGKLDEALDLAAALQKKRRDSSAYDDFRIAGLLATIYNALGQYQRAVEFRKEAVKRALKTSCKSNVATARGNLGLACVNIGDFKLARELFLLHQKYEYKQGYLRGISISHLNLAFLSYEQGDFKQAMEELMKGWSICEQIASFKDMVWFNFYYGAIQMINGNLASAGHYQDQAIDWAHRHRLRKTIDDVLFYKGITNALAADLPGLKKTMAVLKASDGYQLRPVNYDNIEAIYQTLTRGTKGGLTSLKRVLQSCDNPGQQTKFCRTIFLNAQVLKKNKIAAGPLEAYVDKARRIAEKYDMRGWPEWYDGARADQAAGPLRVVTLGNLTVELPGRGYILHKDWEWQKVRDLFAVLVCSYLDKRSLSSEEIGLLLWPEFSRGQVVNNFHVCMTRLKRAIGKEHIQHQARTYALTGVWIDAEHLQELMRDAEKLLSSGIVHGAEKKLDRLIDLHRGVFMKDVFAPWVDARRNVIAAAFRQALFMRGGIAIRKLQFEKSELLGQRLLSLDPLDEESHRFLIHGYLKSGNKAKALAQYERCVMVFRRELDCEPPENIRNLLPNINRM